MLSIATAWLHETSKQPLQIFDYPTQGKSTIRWEPIDGQAYVISFFEFPAIAVERCELDNDILCCFHEVGADKVYSAYIPHFRTLNESDIVKIFRMQRGSRVTALSALIHFSLPESNKYHGKESWEKLTRDSQAKD